MDDELQHEGTLSFWLKHNDPDWTTNATGYNFGVLGSGSVACRAVKHPDKALEIALTGPLRAMQTFKVLLPEAGPEEVLVAITWGDGEVKLHLNGELIQTAKVPPLW